MVHVPGVDDITTDGLDKFVEDGRVERYQLQDVSRQIFGVVLG